LFRPIEALQALPKSLGSLSDIIADAGRIDSTPSTRRLWTVSEQGGLRVLHSASPSVETNYAQ
jgi:hypothetical protein